MVETPAPKLGMKLGLRLGALDAVTRPAQELEIADVVSPAVLAGLDVVYLKVSHRELESASLAPCAVLGDQDFTLDAHIAAWAKVMMAQGTPDGESYYQDC